MLTQRISYVRFAWIGMVFSLLISVVIVSPHIIIRDANLSTALVDYMKVFSYVFSIWIINLFGLWLFETRFNKKYTLGQRVILSFVVVLGFSLLINFFFDVNRPPPPGDLSDLLRPARANRELGTIIYGLVTGLALNTLILFALEVLLLRNTKSMIQAENLKLRGEKLEAVNMMLKQQIQPHFLFNSLNTLKSLMRKNSEVAELYLVKLATFLRGSISTQGNTTVSIKDELALCTNYIELQEMRFGDALTSNFKISDSIKDKGKVPPFSIQLLIENAIKHNQLSDDSPLTIEVTEDNGWIVVSNNLQLRANKEESTGIGLVNLRARYESIANEEILIDQSDHTFQVKIKIL